MAPWPEQGSEPKAPDKSSSKGVDNIASDATKGKPSTPEDTDLKSALGKTEEKQEEKNTDVSELDDGQLKALLDEAISYKCPKDREGKSNLFRGLLEEVEAESECGEERQPTYGLPDQGRNTKRRKKDAVSERQARGGSLQNLVQAYSDFDSVYLGSSGGKKKKRRESGSVNVSARQREGGSLPSNVNSGGILTVHGFGDGFSLERFWNYGLAVGGTVHDISADPMPIHVAAGLTPVVPCKAEQSVIEVEVGFNDRCKSEELKTEHETKAHHNERAVEKKTKSDHGKDNSSDNATELKIFSHEIMHKSEMTPNYTSRATLEVGPSGDRVQIINPVQNGPKDEAKVREVDVDHGVTFNLQEKEKGFPHKDSKVPTIINGIDPMSLQMSANCNAVRSIIDPNNLRDDKNDSGNRADSVAKKYHNQEVHTKPNLHQAVYQLQMPTMQHLSVLSIPPAEWIPPPDSINKFSFPGNKDYSSEGKGGGRIDENGNSVSHSQSVAGLFGTHNKVDGLNNNERKNKPRKNKANNDKNVIMSENIVGHRGNNDIEDLLKYIESDKKKEKQKTPNGATDKNGKKNTLKRDEKETGRPKSKDKYNEDRYESNSEKGGSRSKSSRHSHSTVRYKERGKSNSMEELSKTTIEDLTSNTSAGQIGHNLNLSPASSDNQDKESSSFEGCFSDDYKNENFMRKDEFDSVLQPHYRDDYFEEVDPVPQTEEFHVVTKKQRKKKKRGSAFMDENRGRSRHEGYHGAFKKNFEFSEREETDGESTVMLLQGLPVRKRQQRSADRRKSTSSMPPSDHSESSDLDSVHSLPVSSTTPKLTVNKISTSSGSTPQASYADIARMASTVGQKWKSPVLSRNGSTQTNPDSGSSSACSYNSCSKVAMVVSSMSANIPPSDSECEAASPHDLSSCRTVSVSSQTNDVHASQLRDSCRRDAMTSTTLDIKLVPSACDEQSLPGKGKSKELNILEDNYPSLEESLRKKVVKLNSSLEATATNPNEESKAKDIDGTDKNVGNTDTPSNSCDIIESEKSMPTEVLSEPDTCASNVNYCSSETSSDSMASAKCEKSKELLLPKVKDSSKLRIGKKPGVRLLPPVIILDPQGSCNSGDLSDFTFGFEINEQLLASGEYSDCSVENTKTSNNVSQDSASSKSVNPAKSDSVGAVCKTAGELLNPRSGASEETPCKDFTAMFKSPTMPDTKTFNYDKIVSFIGLAWDETMKEMDVNQRPGRVQYYGGQ